CRKYGRSVQRLIGSQIKTSEIQVNGKKSFGQASSAVSMPRPTTNRTAKTRGVAGTRGPDLNFCVQRKLWISSAVSNTAGTTVENEIVQSRLNSTGLNSSRPRYCQLAVRRLISSNNHQTGAEKQKSSANFFRERDQRELPTRPETKASTTKIYPSQSGKNRTAVRTPG